MIRRTRRRGVAAVVAAWACGLALLVAAPIALPATVAPAPSASAANASDWNAGNIIDDAVFYDGNAMSAGEIQGFLNDKVRNCQSGYTCLKDYRQNTDNRPADKYCNGYSGAPNESAATIIDKVARSCGISQKSLLVLLQKEQGLVTSTAPSAWNYSAATGQGCPDTAPCDASTQGFFYQVYYGARQFEVYRLNPTWWGYQAGRWNNILYNPNGGCGTQRVYIENQATAGLYIYTPYVPNQAALNNLYGTGDGCSAYGNRNFWRTFTDWFGSTRVQGNPFGNIEAIQPVVGGFRVAGWAIDPDTSNPIDVHVYAGTSGTPTTANIARPDVAGVYPDSGPNHGFDLTVPSPPGQSVNVCAYAINAAGVGNGSNTLLGCQQLAPVSGTPIGSFDTATAVEGGVRFTGWAADPDTASPITVHAYIGDAGNALTADATRPDLAGPLQSLGTAHGFDRTFGTVPGTYQACTYALNVGAGANVAMGCKSVTVAPLPERGRTPIGVLEQVAVAGTTANVAGWALDPDTHLPIPVHIYVGSVGKAYTADLARADVGRAWPSYGPNHGFSENVDLPYGTSNVCAYALNTKPGANLLLGCTSVTITPPPRSAPPFGNVEVIEDRSGSVHVGGWALDPDTDQPIRVHVYIGQNGVAQTANLSRPDVASAFGKGASHGFDATLPAPVGKNQVCVYAINDGVGDNTLLSCREVTVTP